MRKRSRPIRLGVVGCGRAAREHHLPAVSGSREFLLAAAADTDPARLDLVAGQFNIQSRFPTHRELLAEGELDAVLVATPTPSHAAIGLDALGAGKHVLLEKPLAMSVPECDQLLRAAAGSGAKVLVAHNSRWHRLALRARGIIRDGALGQVRAVRSTYTHAHHSAGAQHWHRQRQLGGGVLINDGVHHFDLWRFLLDADVIQVRCDSIQSAEYDEDTCTLSARLANGALASAVFSFSSSSNSEVEVFGERGSLLLDFYRFDGIRFTPHTGCSGALSSRLRQASGMLRSLPGGLADLRRGGGFDASYARMWRHFADCLLGDDAPACTLRDGRASVAVALACAESAASGGRVPVV